MLLSSVLIFWIKLKSKLDSTNYNKSLSQHGSAMKKIYKVVTFYNLRVNYITKIVIVVRSKIKNFYFIKILFIKEY